MYTVMTGKVNGSSVNIALVETTGTEIPKSISEKAKGMKRIIRKHTVSGTLKDRVYHAFVEAAMNLNAQEVRNES